MFKYKAILDIQGLPYEISDSFFCGGTLIDKKTVLTASHCMVKKILYNDPFTGQSLYYTVQSNEFYPTYGASFSVYLGLQDKTKLTAEGVVKANVIEAISHPNYDEQNTLNDIGILKLEREVVLNDFIQVACLPVLKSDSYPLAERASVAAGWGTLFYGGSTPSQLYDVQLTVYNSDKCAKVDASMKKNWDSQICAGDLSGKKDTCQGDSGGPLYISDMIGNKTKYVSVGITSYGIGCATLGYPG